MFSSDIDITLKRTATFVLKLMKRARIGQEMVYFFPIINLSFLNEDIPEAHFYGKYISQ